MGFVGISENKMRHILSVARQCEIIARKKYMLDETSCKKAFMIGYLHDIGYEFSKTNIEHPETAYNLLMQTFNLKIPEILYHGDANVEQSLFLAILNEADLTVDGFGNVVSVDARLKDIKDRYGDSSEQYINAFNLSQKLNLIP